MPFSTLKLRASRVPRVTALSKLPLSVFHRKATSKGNGSLSSTRSERLPQRRFMGLPRRSWRVHLPSLKCGRVSHRPSVIVLLSPIMHRSTWASSGLSLPVLAPMPKFLDFLSSIPLRLAHLVKGSPNRRQRSLATTLEIDPLTKPGRGPHDALTDAHVASDILRHYLDEWPELVHQGIRLFPDDFARLKPGNPGDIGIAGPSFFA